MIKLYDVQVAMRDALLNDTDFNERCLKVFGDYVAYAIDKSEVSSVEEYPMVIIHKQYSSDALEGEFYAFQVNVLSLLGEYEHDHYPMIANVEEIAHRIVEILDTIVCSKFGLKRVGVNMFLPAPIDGSDDIEWVINLGYSKETQSNYI